MCSFPGLATDNQLPAANDLGTSPGSHLRVAMVPPDASSANVRRPQPRPPVCRCVAVAAGAAAVAWGREAAVGLVEQHAHHAVVVEPAQAGDVSPAIVYMSFWESGNTRQI